MNPGVHFLVPLIENSKNKTTIEERERFQSLFAKITKHLPGVFYQFRLNPDGSSSFHYASESIIDIYGITAEQAKISAAAAFSIIHPDDLQSVIQSIQISGENMAEWRKEYRVKLKDGSIRWLFGYSTPQPELDGSILWHGYVIDITETKNK